MASMRGGKEGSQGNWIGGKQLDETLRSYDHLDKGRNPMEML